MALTTSQKCPVRRNLSDRAEELGISLADLSRAAGRNAAYMQQFVERGSPKVLPEDVRLAIAIRLNMDERLLGARDPWTPPKA
jgi:cyanate lyase